MRLTNFIIVFLSLLVLSACSSRVPPHQGNVCLIFKTFPHWYWITQTVEKKWGVPISVQMAIMHEESHFVDDAKPAREKLLGFIPWRHRTTAVGYAQATDDTWHRYLQAMHWRSASRDSFSNTVNFIGWYVYTLRQQLPISRNNVYAIYLAYHEGIHGYRNQSYRHNRTLLRIARHVQWQANQYRQQLIRCHQQLPPKPWWWL